MFKIIIVRHNELCLNMLLLSIKQAELATIQIITDIRQAIPKRGFWYQYYDDIFVSVIPSEKIVPHIRRKSVFDDDKKIDRTTCPWHLDWQYKEIEANYGYTKLGKKTYEIQITIENEIHRIDSLVKNVAIEFQHTLSVSHEEMNSRYIAHKKAGYIPYLVIDLTGFSYNTFMVSISQEELKDEPLKLQRLLHKWLKTNYNQNNNLFLDLQDAVIRLSNYFTEKHLRYSKKDFVIWLLNLEEKYQEESIEQRKRNEEDRKQRLIREQKSKEREIEYERREIENEREEILKLKAESDDYKYYRTSMTDKVIRPYIEKYERDRFDYHCDSERGENFHEKYHYYNSKDNELEIQYKTVSKVTVVDSIYKKSELKYLYAEIKITEGKYPNQKIFLFKKEYGKTILQLKDRHNF